MSMAEGSVLPHQGHNEEVRPRMDLPVVIVSAADGSYAMPMTVSLHSALSTLDPARSVIVYIIADGISHQTMVRSLAILRNAHPLVTVEWLAPDLAHFDELPAALWHSRATYLRLLIPTLLPDRIERVLYIDSDVIVSRDISPLWSLDMNGHALMAVENWGHPTLGTAMPQLMRRIDAPPETPYLNSGVLLINLPRWRDRRISERTLDFLQTYRQEIVWLDQDALNAVLVGDWSRLDPSYNVQLATLHDSAGISEQDRRRHLDAASRHVILHYTWKRKPWHWRYSGMAGKTFLHAVAESGWFGFPTDHVWRKSRSMSHALYRSAVQFKDRARRV